MRLTNLKNVVIDMDKENLRLNILRKVENGELELKSASRLLQEIDNVELSDHPFSSVDKLVDTPVEQAPLKEPSIADEQVEKPGWSILFWIFPLLIGVTLLAIASYDIYQNYRISGMNTGFWISFIPLAFGVFFIYLSWALERARWIQLDITQPKGKKPEKIIFAFPLPFRLAGKILKMFDSKLPEKFRALDIQEMLSSLDDQINHQDPVFINVDDDDGTKVKIYLG